MDKSEFDRIIAALDAEKALILAKLHADMSLICAKLFDLPAADSMHMSPDDPGDIQL